VQIQLFECYGVQIQLFECYGVQIQLFECNGVQINFLNVTHKMAYEIYEGKTNDLLVAFIDYVNDINKLQQFTVNVQKSHHRLQCTFQLS
jgi:hypothetical protein